MYSQFSKDTLEAIYWGWENLRDWAVLSGALLLPVLLSDFLPCCWGGEPVLRNCFKMFLPNLTIKWIFQREVPPIFCSFANSPHRIGTKLLKLERHVVMWKLELIWKLFGICKEERLGNNLGMVAPQWYISLHILREVFFSPLPKPEAEREIAVTFLLKGEKLGGGQSFTDHVLLWWFWFYVYVAWWWGNSSNWQFFPCQKFWLLFWGYWNWGLWSPVIKCLQVYYDLSTYLSL